jgi:hypothetical protein
MIFEPKISKSFFKWYNSCGRVGLSLKLLSQLVVVLTAFICLGFISNDAPNTEMKRYPANNGVTADVYFEMQPYRNDVLTKGPHGDVFSGNGKITEARMPVTGGSIGWVRWGDLSTDKKLLKKADKLISELGTDRSAMSDAKTQLQLAIEEMEGNLKNGTKNQKDFANRNLPNFRNMLQQVNNFLNN